MVGYTRDLPGNASSGARYLTRLPEMEDAEVIKTLTAIKGIGVWTAHMFLIFALRRPDVLATGDLGVRMGIKKAYRKRKLPTHKEIEKIARGWHPYCSFACWYLWRSLE